jgi:hypothetical protein
MGVLILFIIIIFYSFLVAKIWKSQINK